MYFRNYRLRKMWLDKCLKIPVSEDSWTVKIASGLKHCCNLNDSTFSTFTNHCESIALEKVSFNDMQNRKTVC